MPNPNGAGSSVYERAATKKSACTPTAINAVSIITVPTFSLMVYLPFV